MRTIKEVFAYCRAVHGLDKQAIVKAISPNAVVTVWDHGDFGQGMGVVGATIQDRPSALICFQGTRGNAKDWARDFEIKVMPSGVDEGFEKEWLQYRDEVSSFVSKLDPTVDIYVTGHSQGGPTAAQCSLYIAEQFCRKAACIAFASPKWCNKTARNKYDYSAVNLTNVSNPIDIVTSVDPKAQRPGKEFVLNNDLWHRIPLVALFWRFAEHTLDSYQHGIDLTDEAMS